MIQSDLAEILGWDSEFWGFVTARVQDGSLTPLHLATIDQWSADNGVRLLYYCCAADDMRSSCAVLAAGFFLTDVRLVMSRTAPIVASSSDAVRAAVPADIPEMQRLAAVCHTNTRFAADPHIDPDRRAELYRYWVARDVTEAPLALVAECGGGVCGYVTGSNEQATGTINLLGVDPATRSAGVGGALLDSALAWCASRGVDEVRLVTQGANVLAQRLFQSRGFRTSSVGLWFHKWYETR